MFRRGGQIITDVRLHVSYNHRIIFVSFFRGDKVVGVKEMIGDFLTRHSFAMCGVFMSEILEAAGYVKYRSIKTADSPTDNFFMYRLPPEYHERFLRQHGLPIKVIDIACHSNARTITITYYVNDPEAKDSQDKKMLIEWDEHKIAQVPTLIDFEFLASTVRRFFLLQENYVEIVNEPKFNRSFPDHFVFEYRRKKSATE